MKTPERILWPTDFSDLSLKASPYARGFRDLFKAELHVVHVSPPTVTPSIERWLPNRLRVSKAELFEAARSQLEQVVVEHFGGDPTVICKVLMGNPWTAICEYAERHDIDLILLATHGLTGVQHILLGSTAERVVHHACCPVLTIKCHERDFK
ncbi:MAG: universal stress protein [Planctomycetota bacterium]